MSIKATISTKGHLIDPHCKYNKEGTLIESNNVVCDCVLNQTDIGSNKNKFYIMQAIKVGPKYIIYIRYGRIGEVGVITYKDFDDDYVAFQFFKKQFKSKTGNNWDDKDSFVKKDKKYNLSIIECAEVSDTDQQSDTDSNDEIDLDERIIDFIKLISNTTYMKNTLVQLEIDTEKMPLGKISQKQIDLAFGVLNEINNSLGKKNKSDKLEKLSSDYYTLIPYACGRAVPPVISDHKLVAKNVDLLNELSQMVFGAKAITKLKKNDNNIANLYSDLHTSLIPLNKNEEMYQMLTEYLENSKGPTHHFNFKIINIFQVDREDERDAYDTYSKKIKNKTLLFHGTRVSNLIGICKNGLVVDPSKLGITVNITGKMFGMGLYFSNTATKSIQYCAYDTSDNIACLFVAEVALGKTLEKITADSSLTAATLPKGYHSTRGIGKSSFNGYDEYNDGTQIPRGKLKPISKNNNASLLYDEFIVYHEEQINIRYVITLRIN